MWTIKSIKSNILLKLSFLIVFLSGCCNCKDYIPSEISFKNIEIEAIKHPRADSSVVAANQMAFTVFLDEKKASISPWHIMVMSRCECYDDVKLASPAKTFIIRTLFDYSPKYPKNADVTELFVWHAGKYQDYPVIAQPTNIFAKTISQRLSRYGLPFAASFFMKDAPRNAKDQFQFEIIFEDKTSLIGTTPIFEKK